MFSIKRCLPELVRTISLSMNDYGKLIPQGGGDVIPLLRERLTFGRRQTCDVCLHFSNISGVHCEMVFQDGCWVLQDLNSKNGVKVNGDLVERAVLHPGDVIAIARHAFVIQYDLGNQETLDDLHDSEEVALDIPLLEKAGLAEATVRSRADFPDAAQRQCEHPRDPRRERKTP